MSEFNPFGAAEEAPDAPEVREEEAGSRKKVLLVGALAALVVGAGAFLFLGGGDDVEEFTPVAQAPVAAAPAAAASPAVKLPVAKQVVLGRNPFRPLYVQPAPAPSPAAAAPAGAVPTGASSDPNLPGSAPGASGASGSATGTEIGSKQPTAKEHKLVLLRVFGQGKDQSAVFSIDGKQQTAKVGSTFGPTAEILLLSLQQGPEDSQWTAVLQVGDADPFDVVTGEPVFVR